MILEQVDGVVMWSHSVYSVSLIFLSVRMQRKTISAAVSPCIKDRWTGAVTPCAELSRLAGDLVLASRARGM